MPPSQPSCRAEFEIAIVCALEVEYNAAYCIFDGFWHGESAQYGKSRGDYNHYTTGYIGRHNVVLTLLHMPGKRNAASAATSLRSSYENLRLVLLVGVCGGMPHNKKEEILLGDVIISNEIIQYDYGRRYPDGFIPKTDRENALSLPNTEIRSFLKYLGTMEARKLLINHTENTLRLLQTQDAQYTYPGADQDKLYLSEYRHMHHSLASCRCRDCVHSSDPVCDLALDSLCDDLRCSDQHLVPRSRLQHSPNPTTGYDNVLGKPMIHIGAIASGDTVMKSGLDRDNIAKHTGAIAYEMEGAGMWEVVPCVVVKGVCDYADSHKNKGWQPFASATAAAVSRAILEIYLQADGQNVSSKTARKIQSYYMIPFQRNESFVGRGEILQQLLERISPRNYNDGCQRTILEGLGGIGKTQIVLEAISRIRESRPDCSIFWVAAISAITFENDYYKIGQLLGIESDTTSIGTNVQRALSQEDLGQWILVVDNADDFDVLFGPNGMAQYLPNSKNGSILFTTRNHHVSIQLEIDQNDIYTIEKLSDIEAVGMLQKVLSDDQMKNSHRTNALINYLDHLPLALKQASIYIAKHRISTADYMDLCQSSDQTFIELLSKDFNDRGRYKDIANPIATTWLISFQKISKAYPIAAKMLSYISFLSEKNIPMGLLALSENKIEMYESIGVLKSYAFLSQQQETHDFDVHRLVRLAMRNWLDHKGQIQVTYTALINQLNSSFKYPRREDKEIWIGHLPHLITAICSEVECDENEALRNLIYKTTKGFFILGNYTEAEVLDRKYLQLTKGFYGEDALATFDAMDNLAYTLFLRGKEREALIIQQKVLKFYQKTTGSTSQRSLVAMDRLSDSLQILNQLDKAEKLQRRSVALHIKTFGKEEENTLRSMRIMADILDKQDDIEEAAKIQEEVFFLSKKVLGETHLSTLIRMVALGNLRDRQGKSEVAENILKDALSVLEKNIGETHPETIYCLDSLAFVIKNQGRFAEAKKLAWKAMTDNENSLGDSHPETIQSARNYLEIIIALNQLEEAKVIAEKLLDCCTKAFGKKNAETLESAIQLSHVIGRMGKLGKAQILLKETIELLMRDFGREDPLTLGAFHEMSRLLARLGSLNEAEGILWQTLSARRRSLGLQSRIVLETMNDLASVLLQRGKVNESASMQLETWDLCKKHLGKGYQLTIQSITNFAVILERLGQLQEAMNLLKYTLEVRRRCVGDEHIDTIVNLNNLAVVFERLGRFIEAEEFQTKAFLAVRKLLGKYHPDAIAIKNNLVNILRKQDKYREILLLEK